MLRHHRMHFLYPISAVIILISLVEGLVLARGRAGKQDWRATGVSILDLIGRHLVALVPFSVTQLLFDLAWEHRVATIPLQGALAFATLFIGQEFCYYWYHRAAHRVRWFWATHAVHHSPNELNLSAAYRLGWTGKLTGNAIAFVPLVWLGFRPEVVSFTLTINLLYQFWIHATWIPRLGWLEYVLNTPSAHRVHHASNLEYLDANYGGVLIIFDRLFGTYKPERGEVPCRYGLVTPVTTHNLLWIEFHVWVGMFRDLIRARSPREVVGYLFAPPGWLPDGNGDTTEDLRRRAAAGPVAGSAGDFARPPVPSG